MRERDSTDGSLSATEVAFQLDGAPFPFVALTESGHAEVDLVEILPRAEDRYAEFYHVSGRPPDGILTEIEATSSVEHHVLQTYENGTLVELQVSDRCPAVALSELGALPRTVSGRNGVGHIVADVPPRHDAGTVVGSFLDQYPTATLEAKREVESISPPFSQARFEPILGAELTDRQREVLETAVDAGYYDWPRQTTGQELADRLGISSATFSQHVHTAVRKVFTALFESRGTRQE